MPLFPYSAETISTTSIVYRSQISKASQLIYQVTLLVVLLTFAALPFIKTTITIKGNGVLQSSLEKTELNIPVNGRLVQYRLADNKKIKQGDTILVIDGGLPKQQSVLVQGREGQLSQFLQDINMLLSFQTLDKANSPNLQTRQYNASWQQFVQELENAGSKHFCPLQ